MKRVAKPLVIIFVSVLIICAISFFTDKNTLGKWKVTAKPNDTMAWAPFFWANDSINGKYFERSAMMIPVTIPGVAQTFSFQFDLGAKYTEIYEANLHAASARYKELQNKTGRLKSAFQFWNKIKVLKDAHFIIGGLELNSENCLIHKNYGEEIFVTDKTDTLPLGTIGADVFQNKVLIIDYPNLRFAVCDAVPFLFSTNMIAIEIDAWGKPVLPMKLGAEKFRIGFDNGSSLFPLITMEKKSAGFQRNRKRIPSAYHRGVSCIV